MKMEQKLLALPGYLRSPSICTGIRVTRSLGLCVCVVDGCLSFFFWPQCCLSFFDLRILITSLWCLQALPISFQNLVHFNYDILEDLHHRLQISSSPITIGINQFMVYKYKTNNRLYVADFTCLPFIQNYPNRRLAIFTLLLLFW